MIRKEYNKIYYQKHRKKILKRLKKYQKTHKQQYKEYYEKNRIKILKQHRQYIKNHQEQRKEYMKEYNQEYNLKYKSKRKKYNKKYKKLNRKQINNRERFLYKTDINYKLAKNLRNRLGQVIKNNSKFISVIKLIGCSVKFLKQYLELQFEPSMTWNNYGKWHVDHIRPCASFDLSKESEQKKCFHYTNLQPLWAKENISKGSKEKWE